jgi:DNA-binding NarL/FixJ family response regulator
MRTLANSALNTPCKIPYKWLENISRKASFYAKQQSSLIPSNKHADGITALSPKESEILHNLYNGLSRPEVANKLGVSINRINSAANKIYKKLNANNIADAVRVATEHKLV